MSDDNSSSGGQKTILTEALTVEGDFITHGNTVFQSIGSDIPTKIVAEVINVVREGIAQHPRVNDDNPVLRAAREKAVARCNAGRSEEASQAFVAAFEEEIRIEKQRREDHLALCQLILEEAVRYDKNANDYEGAVEKLFRIAELRHPADGKAQRKYLLGRSSEIQRWGEVREDKGELILACKICRQLAGSKINGD